MGTLAFTHRGVPYSPWVRKCEARGVRREAWPCGQCGAIFRECGARGRGRGTAYSILFSLCLVESRCTMIDDLMVGRVCLQQRQKRMPADLQSVSPGNSCSRCSTDTLVGFLVLRTVVRLLVRPRFWARVRANSLSVGCDWLDLPAAGGERKESCHHRQRCAGVRDMHGMHRYAQESSAPPSGRPARTGSRPGSARRLACHREPR